MVVKNTPIQPIWKSLSFQKHLKAKTVTQLHQETAKVQNSAHPSSQGTGIPNNQQLL